MPTDNTDYKYDYQLFHTTPKCPAKPSFMFSLSHTDKGLKAMGHLPGKQMKLKNQQNTNMYEPKLACSFFPIPPPTPPPTKSTSRFAVLFSFSQPVLTLGPMF